MNWETKDVLTVVGWPVSCLLSLGVGFLLSRLTRKRKVLAWAVIAERELIAKEAHQGLPLPVTIRVGDSLAKSLSLVTVSLGNAGNEPIENVTVAISVGQGSSIIYARSVGDLGEYQKCIQGVVTGDRATLAFSHINPGRDYAFEVLLSDYEVGSLRVDLAAPGVDIVRHDSAWKGQAGPFLRSIGFGLLGVSYNPQVGATTEIASELRQIRRMMQRKSDAPQ